MAGYSATITFSGRQTDPRWRCRPGGLLDSIGLACTLNLSCNHFLQGVWYAIWVFVPPVEYFRLFAIGNDGSTFGSRNQNNLYRGCRSCRSRLGANFQYHFGCLRSGVSKYSVLPSLYVQSKIQCLFSKDGSERKYPL